MSLYQNLGTVGKLIMRATIFIYTSYSQMYSDFEKNLHLHIDTDFFHLYSVKMMNFDLVMKVFVKND